MTSNWNTFSLEEEQIDRLREGEKILEDRKKWYESVKTASQEFNKILASAQFESGGDLTPSQIDELFRQMNIFAHNRALSNLLYKVNGLQPFNTRLRILLFGEQPLHERIHQFMEMKWVKELTASHFLLMHNPQKYPFYSPQTYDALNLTGEQEQRARKQALSENPISDQEKFDEAITYLEHCVVLQEVKRVLQLENYVQVSAILWGIYDEEKEDEPLPGYSFAAQESQLYDPIKKWLEAEWGTRIKKSKDYYWVKTTANSSRKGNPGKWSRPDITFIEINRLDYLPQRNIQVKSLEVKRVDDADLSSVYEAAAHQRWAHYSYLVIGVPNGKTEINDKLLTEASRLGVGLMTAYPADTDKYKLDELVAPRRQNPDPKELNRLLEDFFEKDDEETKHFKDAIGR